MMRPEADEVHVSVTFTWDIERGKRLAQAWRQYYPIVRIGGPAFGNKPNGFTPGLYLKPGVTFTSRGCNNACPWCLVPHREGQLTLIDGFASGYIIQDNNLLQTPREHQERVYAMLKGQRKAAIFSGGLDARLVDDWTADQFRQLRINSVFLACDTRHAIATLREAVKRLAFLGRDKLRCYVLIGRNETLAEAEERLREVWAAGCMPFAQLYQPAERWISYSPDWKALARTWSRPAAMRTLFRPRRP